MSDTGIQQPTKFEQRVRQAIASLEKEFIDSLDQQVEPPKLSIISFTKRYKLSHSVLYESNSTLIGEIRLAFDKLSAKYREVKRASRRKSVSALEAELAQTRKDAARRVSVAASLSFMDHLQRCGPAFREKTQLMFERQDHIEQIESLKVQVRNQARLIQTLMNDLEKATRNLKDQR